MSGNEPLSTVQQAQNRWLSKFLNLDLSLPEARRRMDQLGVDVPREKPVLPSDDDLAAKRRPELDLQASDVRLAITQQHTEFSQQIERAPQADVPELGIARQQGTIVGDLLKADPLDAKASRSAMATFKQAASTAIAAMAKVREQQAQAGEAASKLQPPDDVDDKEDKQALEALREQLQKITALITAPVPSGAIVRQAEALIAGYNKSADELREAVAKRVQQQRSEILAAADQHLQPLGKFGKVDEALLVGVNELHASLVKALPEHGLTVKAIKAVATPLHDLEVVAGALLGQLSQMNESRRALQQQVSDTKWSEKLPSGARGKLKSAKENAEAALNADLSATFVSTATDEVGKLRAMCDNAEKFVAVSEQIAKHWREGKYALEVTPEEKTEYQETQKRISTFCIALTTSAVISATQEVETFKRFLAGIDVALNLLAERRRKLIEEWNAADADYRVALHAVSDQDTNTLESEYNTCQGIFWDEVYKPRGTYNEIPVRTQISELNRIITALKDMVPPVDTRPPFDPENSATWDLQPISVSSRLDVDANDLPVQQIAGALIGDNNSRLRIVTGVAMHTHSDSNYKGYSFGYNHLGDRRVQPVIYDAASGRGKGKNENDYKWVLTGKGKFAKGPAKVTGVTINRQV